MNTLPSFVEFMSSLGLDNTAASDYSSSPGSTPPLSPQTPPSTIPRRARSQSIPSVMVHSSGPRIRGGRYSPYTATLPSGRRESLSPTNSEFERPVRAYSSSPHLSPSPRLFRTQIDANLSVNIYDSTTDLAANTPISSYVRRKTPPETPITFSFPGEEKYESPSASPMPFTLPTLPPLFSLYTVSFTLPTTPNTDTDTDTDVPPSKSLPQFFGEPFTCRSYRYGVRISTPPRSAGLYRRSYVAPIT